MVKYSTEQALNPEKKDQAGDGTEITIQMEKEALTGVANDSSEEDNVYNETTVPVIRERRHAKQRRRLWLQLILLAGMITGLTLCVLGSIHLYRGMYSAVGYKGRCGVGVIEIPKVNLTFNEPSALKSVTEGWTNEIVTCNLYEEVEIVGPIETIDVPAQNSSAATFRNDFSQNKTLLKDTLRDLCFILDFLPDFDDALVPSPAEFSFTLSTTDISEELPRVYQVEEYFNVQGTVDDMKAEFGQTLSELCESTPVYRTTKVSSYKFPLLQETTAMPTPAGLPLDVLYKMYPGGNALYNYHIMVDNWLYEDY